MPTTNKRLQQMRRLHFTPMYVKTCVPVLGDEGVEVLPTGKVYATEWRDGAAHALLCDVGGQAGLTQLVELCVGEYDVLVWRWWPPLNGEVAA